MPFNQISDLPTSVQNVLPQHAQEIYLAAFNSAWDEYDQQNERRDNDTREETAHKVAWSAVKKKYKKGPKKKWVSQ